MMPTMQEIDEWEERGISTDSVRARLFAAARRGVAADKNLNEMYAERCRLAREIDVAMHGEKDAAKQASLCDLVPSARWLRERAEQLESELAALKVGRDSMQAKIDALMMEYCPDEMTPEQVEEWGKHQKPSPDALKAAQPQEMPSAADDEATRWRHGEPTQPERVSVPVSDERIDEIMAACNIHPSEAFGEVWTGNVQLRKFARALLSAAQEGK